MKHAPNGREESIKIVFGAHLRILDMSLIGGGNKKRF